MNAKNTTGVRRTGAPPADKRARVGGASAGSRSDRELAYVTSGSSALAPDFLPDVDEPVRTRSAQEREAADRRAAERAAGREAGRADVESRRRLRVAPPMPVQIARAPFIAMLLVIVVAGVVGILVLTAMINANQFRLNNLQSQQAGLDAQEQTRQQKLNQLSSPGSLLADAKKLGLVPAGTMAYIQLPNGTVVGAPEPASHVPSVTAQTGAPTSAGSPSGPAGH
jgi:type II secretory pathway pseudopilin PulG